MRSQDDVEISPHLPGSHSCLCRLEGEDMVVVYTRRETQAAQAEG